MSEEKNDEIEKTQLQKDLDSLSEEHFQKVVADVEAQKAKRNPPKLSDMNDHELREYVKKTYGFTHPL